ncbi:hypothetical protein L7F22_004483 [Adiantum nelumboides]|nr:hypothetical protein [Adiantum nelumboides]
MYHPQSFELLTMGMPEGDDLERRWKDFFGDYSEWWDYRRIKPSPRHPDFKHKVTKDPLWMDSRHNPPWVMEELVSRGLAADCCCIEEDTRNALSASRIWACCKNKDLWTGTSIHNEILRRGLVEKNYSDALVTMYAKCRKLQKAQALLDMYNSSIIIPWNALIAGYVREGKGQNALQCFEKMQWKGHRPSAVTYGSILKACAMIGAIDKGKQIFEEILTQGLLHNLVLGNSLVDMFAKCGALYQAQSVLEKLPSRNVISWSILITGYAQNGQGQQALDCFEQMQL